MATRTAYVAYATAKDRLKTIQGVQDGGKRMRYPHESVRSLRLAVRCAQQAYERALAAKESVASDCPSWPSCVSFQDVNGYSEAASPEWLVALRYSVLVALAEDRVNEARMVFDEAAEVIAVGPKTKTRRVKLAKSSKSEDSPRLALGARYCAFQRYLRARSELDRAEDELHDYHLRLLPCRAIGEWV